MRLLELLARADGQLVSREALFDGIWPNQEISDQTLSSLVSRLRKQLGDDPRKAQFIGTVPKKGYRLLQPVRWVSVEGVDPGTRAHAPAAEPMTGDDKGSGRSPGARSHRWLLGLATTGLVVVLALVGLRNGGPESSRGAVHIASNSVAVLPFDNLSPSADMAYFSDGIAEELLNQLAAVPGLKVASRTSSFRQRGDDQDIRAIGADLNVRHVLEGSVRREGERLRVAVQLVDARTGYHRWSNTYDGRWQDVLQVQQAITRAVVEQIRPRLLDQLPSTADTGGVSTARAYELYLLGRHHWRQRTEASLARATELFRQAAQVQPDYALAYTGLAETYLTALQYGDVEPEAALDQAERILEKALALGPRIAETRLALGNLRIARTQWEAAERELLAALESNPNLAEARMSLGNVYTDTGRLSLAYDQYRRALSIDPLHATVLLNLANVSLKLGLPDRAETYLDRAEALMPGHTFLFGFRTVIYQSDGNRKALSQLLDDWWSRQPAGAPDSTQKNRNEFLACGAANTYLGRFDLARRCLAPLLPVAESGDLTARYSMMALSYQALLERREGRIQRAEILCDKARALGRVELLRFPENRALAYEMSAAHAVSGDRDAALASLRRAYDTGVRHLGLINNDPRFHALRDSPEFEATLDAMAEALAQMRFRSLRTYPVNALAEARQGVGGDGDGVQWAAGVEAE